jgi:hypothetical protein
MRLDNSIFNLHALSGQNYKKHSSNICQFDQKFAQSTYPEGIIAQ